MYLLRTRGAMQVARTAASLSVQILRRGRFFAGSGLAGSVGCEFTRQAVGRHRRPFSTVQVTFKDEYGELIPVQAEIGETLLEVAHNHDIELEGACGGELACSTCHIVLPEEWYNKVADLSAVSEEEEDMLDLAIGLTDTSRLGCQICVTKDLDGLEVSIPEDDF